jgi:hypothetical protein
MREITGQVETMASGFRLDRRTGHYVQSITLVNLGAQPVQGPLYVDAEALPGVSMAGDHPATAATGPPRQLGNCSALL